MICRFCGNEIADNAEYCFVCGQRAAADAAQPEPPEAEAPAGGEPQVAPVAEPAAPADYAAVDPADVQKAGRFTRFICFLFPLIGVIIYLIRAKQGQTGKKRSVANATMFGVCFYLILAIAAVVMKTMF